MTSQKFTRGAPRKTIAILLIVSLTALIAPSSIAAPALRETPRQLRDLLIHLDSWKSTFGDSSTNSIVVDKRTRKNHAAPFRSPAQKEAEVAEIRMNCSYSAKIHSQEPIQFIGVPVDSRGDAINGLGVKWLSSNNEVLAIDNEGRANPRLPGKVTVDELRLSKAGSCILTLDTT
jgi:hypothetical protein